MSLLSVVTIPSLHFAFYFLAFPGILDVQDDTAAPIFHHFKCIPFIELLAFFPLRFMWTFFFIYRTKKSTQIIPG